MQAGAAGARLTGAGPSATLPGNRREARTITQLQAEHKPEARMGHGKGGNIG